jgi:uncharacterized membrane protein
MPIVRSHFSEVRPDVRKTRQHLRGMFEVLTTEPLDAERLRHELAQLRAVNAVTQQKSHESFVELVAAMSKEERVEMAEMLRRGPRFERNGPARARGMDRADQREPTQESPQAGADPADHRH